MASSTAEHHPREMILRQRMNKVDDALIAGWEHPYQDMFVASAASLVHNVVHVAEIVPRKIAAGLGRLSLIVHK